MFKVVVIGGGYGGISALRELSKRSDIEITLIDKHSYHNLQPEVYDYIANKIDAADMTIDLITFCKGLGANVNFYNNRVTDIDFEKNIVHTEEGNNFPYDQVIIAIGARTFFPRQLEGLDRTNDLKKLHKALSFKQKFEFEIFKKIDNEGRACEQFDIVVVGAGLSGVEIAAEMAYYASYIFKKGLFACDYMSIHLISATDTVLPGMDPYLIEKSTERLKELNVNLITGKHMSRADENFVYLNDGTKIRHSFIIFAGGIEAANLTSKFNLEKNQRGQILTDEYGRAKGKNNVFVCGDVMSGVDTDGNPAPATVQIALQTGKYAAKNAINTIDRKELVKYRCKNPGVMIALGGRYACGMVGKSIKISGLFAFIAKHLIFFKYRKPLQMISKRGYCRLNIKGNTAKDECSNQCQ